MHRKEEEKNYMRQNARERKKRWQMKVLHRIEFLFSVICLYISVWTFTRTWNFLVCTQTLLCIYISLLPLSLSPSPLLVFPSHRRFLDVSFSFRSRLSIHNFSHLYIPIYMNITLHTVSQAVSYLIAAIVCPAYKDTPRGLCYTSTNH